MAPVRIGIIGSGAVAQVQHLPNLAALKDLYTVEMVCDLSPSQARIVAEEYHVPHHTGDWRELLAHDLDAVILCHTDPKTEIAVAALRECVIRGVGAERVRLSGKPIRNIHVVVSRVKVTRGTHITISRKSHSFEGCHLLCFNLEHQQPQLFQLKQIHLKLVLDQMM